MIAKLITHGETRAAALAQMREALNAFVIRGISSNIAFQAVLVQHPRFVAGDFTTGFLAEEFPRGFHAPGHSHQRSGPAGGRSRLRAAALHRPRGCASPDSSRVTPAASGRTGWCSCKGGSIL